MFQFPGLTLLAEWYTFSVPGCPIRKSSDISLVCSSPKLIAAYHVLHRLSEPRHPPYALKCFKRVITITRHLQLNKNLSQYVKELLLVSKENMSSPARSNVNCWCYDYESPDHYVTSSGLKELFLWRISESNRWPSACKADALANWANPPKYLRMVSNRWLFSQ